MNLNGVELSERELQSLLAAVEEAVYHWSNNERMAFTSQYKILSRARRLDLERIEKLLTEATECTAKIAEE